MTESNSAWPTAAETADVLRFLHRFADLMSNGNNSDNLLRAARMLQAHIDLLKESTELLQAQIIPETCEACVFSRYCLSSGGCEDVRFRLAYH